MSQNPRILRVERRRQEVLLERLERSVASVLRGKDEVIRLAITCLLARGHLLIEDIPGVGKTTLAKALARSLGVELKRIQFTSDLLPSDIIGVNLFDQGAAEFRFRPGPLFANVVLADEINRATPKTQSALLEAMSERRVSIERDSHELPDPFIVLATQNPLEHQGTFPLPESQLDRFLMMIEVGYPPHDDERELLLSGGVQQQVEDLAATLDVETLRGLQQDAAAVTVAEKLADYLLAIARETRTSGEFAVGVSTRGLQGLFRAVQAHAYIAGRDYATPDDVQNLVVPVLAHRVVLSQHGASSQDARDELTKVVRKVSVPL